MAIRERLQSLDQELKRVVDVIATIGLSEALRVKLRLLEEEKKVALLTMVDAETTVQKYSVDMNGIRKMLERDVASVESGNPDELRRVLQIYGDQIKIFPPPTGKRSGHKIEARLSIIRPEKKHEGGDDSPPNMPTAGTPKEVLSINMLYVI